MPEKKLVSMGLKVTDTSQAPKGDDIFYRCLACGVAIPSTPKDSIGCSCRNITIDTDYLRLVIRDYSLFDVMCDTAAPKRKR